MSISHDRLATVLFLSAALGASTCAAEADLQGVWNLSNLTPLERLPGFDSLVISREQASAIEERIAGMRRTQPTGAAAEGFDEEQAVEPIKGEWHSSVLVEPIDGRIPGNAAFREEAARYRSRELIFEFACHEGNYAVQFVLQGLRAQEAARGGH